MLAGSDRLAGKADDLVIAPHRVTSGDGVRRDFVAGRNQSPGGDRLHTGTSDQL